MDKTQRGNRLGPYRLAERYKHTESLGRIHRARNLTTGAPALLLQRTERQADEQPLADWQVLVTSSVSPSFLALEVVRAPAAGVPADIAEELVFMLGDAEQLANEVVDRPETMPHLRAAPRASPARQVVAPPPALRSARDWRRPALAAGLAALAAAAVLHLGGTGAGLELRHDAGAELAQMDAGWAGDGAATGLVLTSTADGLPFAIARAMPRKPFDDQKRPPCNRNIETELFNGCWVATDKPTPCPDELYEYRGKCYLPAAMPKAAPRAVTRQPLAFDRP